MVALQKRNHKRVVGFVYKAGKHLKSSLHCVFNNKPRGLLIVFTEQEPFLQF